MPQAAKSLSSPLHLLQRVSQRADGLFSRNVRDADLTPRQFAVLQAVADNNGLSQTDIMAATGIDRSSTAELVRRLVTNGSLQRRRKRSDARIYVVRTPERAYPGLGCRSVGPGMQYRGEVGCEEVGAIFKRSEDIASFAPRGAGMPGRAWYSHPACGPWQRR
jgi:hypothetical protein